MRLEISRIEPFAMIGKAGIISSREDAVEVLRQNSYYFKAVGFLGLILAVIILLKYTAFSRLAPLLVVVSTVNVICGFLIGTKQSRIASIIMLVTHSIIVLTRIFQNDIGGLFFVSIIVLMAAIRSLTVSLKHHKFAL